MKGESQPDSRISQVNYKENSQNIKKRKKVKKKKNRLKEKEKIDKTIFLTQ